MNTLEAFSKKIASLLTNAPKVTGTAHEVCIDTTHADKKVTVTATSKEGDTFTIMTFTGSLSTKRNNIIFWQVDNFIKSCQ